MHIRNCEYQFQNMLVNDWYKDRNIFITGGTGFIGKVLIEKLLRSCPNVGNIYLLIRGKKGKGLQERLEEMLSGPLFDLLKETNPKALNKIVPISGDITKKGLGLSDEDRQLLIERINVIFNVAASVRFDDCLEQAILINVRSAQEMALLALQMKSIKVFLHVSTAYCINSTNTTVEEEFHPQSGNWRDAIYIAENDNDGLSSALLHKFIEGYPNTYTFTKQLAEHCIKDLLEFKIPTVIARPTIVSNIIDEPLKGFTDNLNGPTGMALAGGLGILRMLRADGSKPLDQVPVDIVVKALILSALNIGVKGLTKNIPIIHVSSYGLTQILAADYMNISRDLLRRSPFQRAIWVPNVGFTMCWYNYLIQVFLFQLLPAIFIDLLAKLSGHKPQLFKIQRKIFIANMMLSHFLINSWNFKNDNFIKTFEMLSESDQLDFGFHDVDNSQLRDHFQDCINFMKKEILKESTVKPARNIIQKIIYVIDDAVKAIFYLTCFWTIFFKVNVFSFLYSYLYTFVNSLCLLIYIK
ncbi:putative fatty acyl-CoA reductase CG8306 isoform X1 [Rhynchophorus ferrugineus]|uniref:putative fatty acyl-CoA reductase CG8306 isoform X1 n=1 Tax=Rhynchophorus ferrugineus TaxID=354439 RepID=UPI003FCC36C8